MALIDPAGGMLSMRLVLSLLLVSSLFAQDAGADHGEAKWAKATSLPVQTVHRLWRSMSHFADENDDDSQIVLFDAEKLASRGQLLIVTAAGLPTCLALAVFSQTGFQSWRQVWSESSTPKGQGFCEAFGIEPEVTVAQGKILVKAAVGLNSAKASHADLAQYIYTWTGKTYTFCCEEMSLQFVPPSERPTPR